MAAAGFQVSIGAASRKCLIAKGLSTAVSRSSAQPVLIFASRRTPTIAFYLENDKLLNLR